MHQIHLRMVLFLIIHQRHKAIFADVLPTFAGQQCNDWLQFLMPTSPSTTLSESVPPPRVDTANLAAGQVWQGRCGPQTCYQRPSSPAAICNPSSPRSSRDPCLNRTSAAFPGLVERLGLTHNSLLKDVSLCCPHASI